ncbi:MAG: RDD family protein [Deltaproteobacteria bacterium]|nr:RDD family protein [Deltaproteobacteria bacterium]
MTDRRYGGFWRRLFAFLIDKVILYFVSLTLFLIGLLALGLSDDMMDRIPTFPSDLTYGMVVFALLYLIASLLAGMTYFTWFHGIAGRTPGKMLFGLCVIQISGDPMTPGIAFLRWVGYLISGPVLCLGFLWIAFDGRKQGWHDKIAATLVIREKCETGRNAYRHFTENAACSKTAPADVAVMILPSHGEPETFVPPPEGQPKRPCTDDFVPYP